MLDGVVSTTSRAELLTKCVDFTDDGCIFEGRRKCDSCVKCWGDSEPEEGVECGIIRCSFGCSSIPAVLWIYEFLTFFPRREEIFLSKRGFIRPVYEMDILGIKCFSFYFTRSSIDDESATRDEEFFWNLSEICEMRTMEDLVSRDISIDSVHADIWWHHFEEICHESDKCLIIIGCKTTISPYFCELAFICHHHWIYLEFVWAVSWIIKDFLEWFTIKLWCWSEEIWHDMSTNLESCILEHLCTGYGFSISMSSFIYLIDFINGLSDSRFRHGYIVASPGRLPHRYRSSQDDVSIWIPITHESETSYFALCFFECRTFSHLIAFSDLEFCKSICPVEVSSIKGSSSS